MNVEEGAATVRGFAQLRQISGSAEPPGFTLPPATGLAQLRELSDHLHIAEVPGSNRMSGAGFEGAARFTRARTVNQVAKRLGVTAPTVYCHINKLAGSITSLPGHKYQATSNGATKQCPSS